MTGSIPLLFDLRSYPSELLAAILSAYCDRNDLLNLWLAAIGSREHADLLWPLLVNHTDSCLDSLLESQQPREEEYGGAANHRSIPRRRIPACLQILIRDELNSKTEDASSYHPEELSETTSELERRRHQTMRLGERLALVAYHESLHGVLWCGRMEFSIPRNGQQSFQETKLVASVKLCCFGGTVGDDDDDAKHHHPPGHFETGAAEAGGCEKEMKSWSFVDLRAWNACFPNGVVRLRSQPYNFAPVPPYGRLQGLSRRDRDAIRKARLALEESDQVMTLVVRNKRMILRVISPQQARRRLSRFPSLAGKFEKSAAAEGLLGTNGTVGGRAKAGISLERRETRSPCIVAG